MNWWGENTPDSIIRADIDELRNPELCAQLAEMLRKLDVDHVVVTLLLGLGSHSELAAFFDDMKINTSGRRRRRRRGGGACGLLTWIQDVFCHWQRFFRSNRVMNELFQKNRNSNPTPPKKEQSIINKLRNNNKSLTYPFSKATSKRSSCVISDCVMT